jgi:glycosyltransferase involved in cell wall biosynthesis
LERKFGFEGFLRELGQAADALIVHQPIASLERQVPAEKIAVIAHGTGAAPASDRETARAVLGVPLSVPLMATAGFIHIQKNLQTAIRAVAHARLQHPSAMLIIAGSIQNPSWANRAYFAYLGQLIRQLRQESHIRLWNRFVPDEELAALCVASDLLLFPYWQGYGSASGVVHHALAAGTPLLCSRSPKFEEVRAVLGDSALLPAHRPKLWGRRIAAVLDSPAELAAMRDKCRGYAERTRWPAVGEHTRQLYLRLLGQRAAA